MAKTRSQTLSVTVKKEVCEDKTKLKQLLHGKNNTSNSKKKITKKRTRSQAEITKVKSENVHNNEAFLALPSKASIRKIITKEQITKLIDYIVNDEMDVAEAGKRVGISQSTAYSYYYEYQRDPEHKIPEPRTYSNKRSPNTTQQKIDDLIHYVVNDKMNLTQASKKADMRRTTAATYYATYLKDPERKIPLLAVRSCSTSQPCTKEKITDLIGYIVRDKMTVAEASKKVNVSVTTGRKHYLRYLHNPNHTIADPRETKRRYRSGCTADQISSLIGYIVNDGMSMFEASVKANISGDTARKYYRQYINDPEKNIPVPKTNVDRSSSGRHTLDQIKNFFCHIIIDKLNVSQAARTAKILESSGWTYYNKYLMNYKKDIKHENKPFSVEKMKRLIEIVQNEKITVSAAADMVDLTYPVAIRHYRQYLKDPHYEFPDIKNEQCTQEDIERLIDCVERKKMSIRSTAKKIKMRLASAHRYYKIYQNDPEHKIPAPTSPGQTLKNSTLSKYTQIIDDIYKENPSIKPIYGKYDPNLDVPDIEIKNEIVEEDNKMLLKV